MSIFSRNISQCHSIDDLRSLAQLRLPKVMFDYMDGGAEDEFTLRRNSQGFDRYQFIPNALVDVSEITLGTSIQGIDIDLPVIFAPTGGTRLFHHTGELSTSAAAEKAGTIFTLSSMSTYNIEEVGQHTNGTKWFQIYVWKDRSVVREFIQRCKDSGYQALCLTVDAPTSGNRERDLRNGMTIPPKFTMSTLLDMAAHPRWWSKVITTPKINMANVAGRPGMGANSATAHGQYAISQLDTTVTWDDMAWMIQEWGGPFLIKGILSVHDAIKAVETGVTGMIISNHGGRQLDHAAATIDVLPDIVEAVGDRTEIILDSGIRRGVDVIKALALGADACMIGRSFLYGLGAGGQAGAERSIEIIRSEIERAMKLMGCTDIKQINRSYLRESKPIPVLA